MALGNVAPGFVATMGALHEGHVSLIRRSASENSATVVSIFVNPTQFSDPLDLVTYPRDVERDALLATAAGADLVFVPKAGEIYPREFRTWVEVGGLGDRWEGAARPGHFRGVATVVAILLNLVRPERAYLGEKDYQQLVVVRRMHADLGLPGNIVACPTVRDHDGLALSSRNVRLSEEQRNEARVISRALRRMVDLTQVGETDARRLTMAARDELAHRRDVAVEYVEVVDGETLEPLPRLVPGARAILAVRVGETRLIDNVALERTTNGAGTAALGPKGS
jgi:pantoate--beta-alanine ligase